MVTEISKSDYVAVMSDGATDVLERTQEWFWRFFKSGGQNADILSECILNE